MTLFDQQDFSGGLDASAHPTKTGNGKYPLLLNGRVRENVVAPVRKHLTISGLPPGPRQALTVAGDYLITVIAGELYYKNLLTDEPWAKKSGLGLVGGDRQIFHHIVPVSTNLLNLVSGESVFNSQIAPTPQALFLTDGVNRPVAVFANLAVRVLGDYAGWSRDNPEYVPLGILPTLQGNALYLTSPDRQTIVRSVSGRYFDFVINRQSDGSKGGTADTLALAVDYNEITGTFPANEGLLVTTLYATYLALPAFELFGETFLRPQLLFPVGAVNERSFVDIGGDIAFISQGGIQSINIARQLQAESNNTPLTAAIGRYIVPGQTRTAAVNFDDYALFAMNSTIGRVVFVYDISRQQFVSMDTGFGEVKEFVVWRKGGKARLFFTTFDDRLVEAYGSEEYETCRLLLGEWTAGEARTMVKMDALYATFMNNPAPANVLLAAYIDRRKMFEGAGTIDVTNPVETAPVALPFVNAQDTAVVKAALPMASGFKASVFLQWEGPAVLTGVSVDGSTTQSTLQQITKQFKIRETIAVCGNWPTRAPVATGSGYLEVPVTKGQWYYIYGEVSTGERKLQNAAFTAPGDFVWITGTLFPAEDMMALTKSLHRKEADLIVTTGNNTDGSSGSFGMLMHFMPAPLAGVAGADDKLINAGATWFSRHEKYGRRRTEFCELFFIDEDSADQRTWLQTSLADSDALYKIVVSHLPLDLPLHTWKADLYLTGEPGKYERFYANALPRINSGLGSGGGGIETPGAVKHIATGAGYVVLRPSAFSLDVEFCGGDGLATLDATTIHPR